MSRQKAVEDLESFRVTLPVSVQKRKVRQDHRYRRAFLKGPVQMDWLRRAMPLPGCALAVALILRFFNGIQNAPPAIKVTYAKIQTQLPGCNLRTVQRGMKALEQAGLIVVKRPPGRMMEIELVEVAAVTLQVSDADKIESGT